MSNDIEDIVIPILRNLQEGQSLIRGDIRSMKEQFAAMEKHLAASHATQAYQSGALAEVQVRLDRVEKRLGLFDPAVEDPNS